MPSVMNRYVESVKSSSKEEVGFMTLEMKIEREKKEARDVGLREGRREGILLVKELISKLQNGDITIEEAAKALEDQTD